MHRLSLFRATSPGAHGSFILNAGTHTMTRSSITGMLLLLAGVAGAQPCLVGYNLTASTPPSNGTYACGQTVTFCLTVTSWNTTNANWFHGAAASFGPGWDLSTLTPGPPPPACGTGGGTWGWYSSVQGTSGSASGPQGPGFFYDLNNDGNPGNNFGDYCTGPWTFCWTISVLNGPACVNGSDLGVSVNTFGDSETGSWGSSACTGDVIVPSTPAVIQSCALNAGVGGPLALCNSSGQQDLAAALTGSPDPGGTWTDPNGAPFSGALDAATAISGNYSYTLTSTAPPCSATAVIAVSIAQQPNAGINSTSAYCSSSPSTSLLTELGGSPEPGGTWSGPNGPHTGTLLPATDPSGTYTYTISGTAPCTNASASVEVVVNPTPDAGTGNTMNLCSNSAAVDLFNSLGGAPSAIGTWTGPAGTPATSIYDPAVQSPGNYTYTVVGAAPCPNSQSVISVIENPLPNAGNNGTVSLCNTTAPGPLLNFLNGTPDPGGTWTDPSGSITSAVLDPGTAASGTYTYTVIGAAPCPSVSATVQATIDAQPNAGSSGTLNLCDASPATDLFTALGGTPEPGGTWFGPSGTITTSSFNPAASMPGVYSYNLPANGSCTGASATVTVSVNPQPNAGTDGTLTLCSNSAASSLFGQLGPDAQPGGLWTGPSGLPATDTFTPGVSPDGSYTYTIAAAAPCASASATVTTSTVSANNAGTGLPITLCATGVATDLFLSIIGGPDPGGTWTTPEGAPSTGTLSPATSTSGNYTYSIPANGPCPAASTIVAVDIIQLPNAGTNGTLSLCSNTQAASILLDALGGAPDADGDWSAPDGSIFDGSFDVTIDPPGTYTYTVNGVAPCGSASSSVQVSLVTAPQAGTGTDVALCENTPPMDPISWLNGTPDATGTWTGPQGSFTTFDPASAVSGAYTYTVSGTAPCSDAQATVQVTIDALPNAGVDNAIILCSNANPVDLFGLLGSAQPSGSWTGPSGVSNTIFDPALNQPGAYSYTVVGSGACAAEQDVATVQVTVTPIPDPTFDVQTTIGCVPLRVAFVNTTADTDAATWSFGDAVSENATDTAWHTYDLPGTFDVELEITDGNGCTASATLPNAVTVSSGPAAQFYALPLRISVNSPVTYVQHNADPGVDYIWRIDTTIVDTSGAFAWNFAPAEIGLHPICLTATDALGCSNTFCLDVLVDDDLTIFVANAFTPNGDQYNDTFKPSILGVEADRYEFLVFDRWGLLVFSTTDPSEGWNGGMNNTGDPLPDGVYVWTLKAKDQFTPEKQELIGTVTLLK